MSVVNFIKRESQQIMHVITAIEVLSFYRDTIADPANFVWSYKLFLTLGLWRIKSLPHQQVNLPS